MSIRPFLTASKSGVVRDLGVVYEMSARLVSSGTLTTDDIPTYHHVE